MRPTPSAGATDGACVVRMIGIALRKSEIGKSRAGSHPIHPLLPQARRGETQAPYSPPNVVGSLIAHLKSPFLSACRHTRPPSTLIHTANNLCLPNDKRAIPRQAATPHYSHTRAVPTVSHQPSTEGVQQSTTHTLKRGRNSSGGWGWRSSDKQA